MKTSPRKQFFTLIEIMVVIVIAAIMFGIGIPAFSTMIQGNTMTQAIRMTTAKIKAARAYAVVNKCKVALLLPGKDNTLQEGDTSKDHLIWSAYRVCVVDDSNAFVSWIDGEDWKTLPIGILRAGDTSADNKDAVSNEDKVTLPSGELITGENPVPAMIFRKNGQLAKDYAIGFWHGRAVGGKPIWTQNREGNDDIKFKVAVSKYTGKTTITDPNEKEEASTPPAN